MPKYSNYVRTRIELLHNQGLHPAGILKTLKGEGLVVSLSGITRLIKKLHLTGSVANLPRSGRPRKLPVKARAFIGTVLHAFRLEMYRIGMFRKMPQQ